MDKVKNKYVWDSREGHYFLEWWEGKKRCRELAGQTPSEALEARRRKRNEIIGEMVAGGKQLIQTEDEGQRLPIDTAVQIFRVLAALRRRRENYMRHVRLPHGRRE